MSITRLSTPCSRIRSSGGATPSSPMGFPVALRPAPRRWPADRAVRVKSAAPATPPRKTNARRPICDIIRHSVATVVPTARSFELFVEPVTQADHGLDLLSGRAQLRAEPPDVYVHRSCLDEAVVAPHALEQAIPRQHPILVLHQEAQQFELAAGEPHGRLVHRDRHGIEIRDEMLALVGGLPRVIGARAPAQDRADARAQLAKAERLRHVVVGPQIETADTIRLRGPRGQHDDRDQPRLRPLPQDPADLVAADHGEVEIQDDEIGWPDGDRPERLIPPADDFDRGATGSFERVLDQAGDVLFVLDHEDARRRHDPLCIFSMRAVANRASNEQIRTIVTSTSAPAQAWRCQSLYAELAKVKTCTVSVETGCRE